MKMKKYIFNMLTFFGGILTGMFCTMRFAETELKKERQNVNNISQISSKHFELFMLMNQWVKVKQKGENIGDYLERRGYNRIAIYGMSYVGDSLVRELKKSNVQVLYGIDQKADTQGIDIDVVTIEDTLKMVDAIVVTAVTYYDEIKKALGKKVDFPIISLRDILYDI